MGIHIKRCACPGVAETTRDRHNILSGVNQHTRHSMAEGVRVDMRKLRVLCREFAEIGRQTVRVDYAAVILDKYIFSALPAIPVLEAQLKPILPIVPEQRHCLRGQFEKSSVAVSVAFS